MTDLTASNRSILTHLADGHACYGRHLAQALWPDSPAWNRMSRGWNGTVGKPMPGNAGRLATRMAERGLVARDYGLSGQTHFTITAEGRRRLEEPA